MNSVSGNKLSLFNRIWWSKASIAAERSRKVTVDASLLSVLEGLSSVLEGLLSVLEGRLSVLEGGLSVLKRRVVSVRRKVVSVRRKVVSDNDQCYFCAVFFPVCGLTGLRRTTVTVVVLKQPFQSFILMNERLDTGR